MMTLTRVFRIGLAISFWSIIMGCALGLGITGVFFYQVYFGDDSYLKKSTILAKINEETRIYYLDEKTQMGSFFDDMHRKYITIEDIPQHLIDAFVASEDKYYYDHNGINPIAIGKAITEGVRDAITSGFKRIHFRGGSTITQQTVKNILDKRDYSIARKFREGIAALQLERLYSKKQILEFYFNQFHVTANGNGVGIAARYYFDKLARDLDLVECAFIAGSVKAPSRYNPFIKYSKEDRVKAENYAKGRKNYVIRRMFEMGWISKKELDEAWKRDVPFNKGKFTTREVALVSLIRSQLKKKEVLEALNLESINDLNKAGFRVFTTIDDKLQKSAQLMMRRNLSRLETILGGFVPEDPASFKPLRDLESGRFYYAKIEKVTRSNRKFALELDLGLAKATVPHEALVRYAKFLDIAQSIGWEKRLTELLKSFKKGQIVFIEIREYDQNEHHGIAELQKRPLINGGLIALDKGEIRAIVSGFDSQGYNRAIFGKRQPGSVFKTVVYYAALQLGWSMLDNMDNTRQLFPFQDQFYYPQADHNSPYQSASMIWSGTKSENLSTVNLTYNLLEKLNESQFLALMDRLGLEPTPGESTRDYQKRVSKKIGVHLDNRGIRMHQLSKALSELLTEKAFSSSAEELERIRKMWWGNSYLPELQRLYQIEVNSRFSAREKQLRIDLLLNNYLRYQNLETNLKEDWQRLTQIFSQRDIPFVLRDPIYRDLLQSFKVIVGKDGRKKLVYNKVLPGEESSEKNPLANRFEPHTKGRGLNIEEIRGLWLKDLYLVQNPVFSFSDILLAENISVSDLNYLRDRTSSLFQLVTASRSPFQRALYFQHHDFRIALGLEYLKALTIEMGVFSEIEPVLSFPLGTNVVSVAEVAKIYQTFTEGKVYQFYKKGPPNQLNLIRRIEDRYGQTIFEPERREFLITAPNVNHQVQQILRKVVTNGTGRRANTELYLRYKPESQKKGLGRRIRIPSFGKTGTTNQYRTASFAGFVPYPMHENALLEPAHSYVLASYVGYDDNTEMVKGRFKVSGFHGALPVWTDFARSIIEETDYIDKLDTSDIDILENKLWPLKGYPDLQKVSIDLARGTILNQPTRNDRGNFGTTDYSNTGETYVDEFEDFTGNRATVSIPRDETTTFIRPKRAVRFFATAPRFDQELKRYITDNTIQPQDDSVPDEPSGKSRSPSLQEQSDSIPSSVRQNTPPAPQEKKQAALKKRSWWQRKAEPPPQDTIPEEAPPKIPRPKTPLRSRRITPTPRPFEMDGVGNAEDSGFIEEELW